MTRNTHTTTPAAWTDVCSVADIPEDGGHYVVLNRRALAVFRDAAGEVVVLDDTCPHAGGSLSAGGVDHATGCAVCPWHGWAFELETGQCPDSRHIAVRRYPARIIGDRVQMRL